MVVARRGDETTKRLKTSEADFPENAQAGRLIFYRAVATTFCNKNKTKYYHTHNTQKMLRIAVQSKGRLYDETMELQHSISLQFRQTSLE